MTTIRVGRRDRYTIIDRGALNDRRLSFRARGILGYLLDKPDDWETTADAVAAAGREGREAVRTALRELESAGYLVRKKWRDLSGRWMSEWTVYERPVEAKPLVGARADFRRRETGAGYPRRFPGPQVMSTETENSPRQAPLFSEDDTPAAPPPWRESGESPVEWMRGQEAG